MLTALRILMVPFYGVRAAAVDGGDSIAVALRGLRCSSSWRWSPTRSTATSPGPAAWSPNFGKIADPIADKAMTGMAFIGLSIVGDIWWWVTIVVLLREWTRHPAAALDPQAAS